MIQLDVAKYCHECPAFDPITHVLTENHIDVNESGNLVEVEVSTTYIRCRDWKRCKAIERYIRKQLVESANHSEDE